MTHDELIIIAEAGVNHNGDLPRAFELVRAAKRAGADVVKFQHFRASAIASRDASSAAYQIANAGEEKQQRLLAALELDVASFIQIAKVAREEGIAFLCTLFDPEAAADLVAIGMPYIKIPSGELTNLPMLRSYCRFGLPILLSTGMGTMDEVASAMSTLQQSSAPSITLLQCTSLYPAPAETLNLRAMTTMRDRFGVPVGFSDHSLDDHAAIAAVALGATVIEKHLTLDRHLPGPDHRASLEEADFARMVLRLRDTRIMLGDGEKRPADLEIETALRVRRSWHATRALPIGTVISAGDVTLKRPAHGLSPMIDPVGRKVVRSIAADEPISANALA